MENSSYSSYSSRKPTYCKFYQTDRCSKGDQCQFVHEMIPGTGGGKHHGNYQQDSKLDQLTRDMADMKRFYDEQDKKKQHDIDKLRRQQEKAEQKERDRKVADLQEQLKEEKRYREEQEKKYRLLESKLDKVEGRSNTEMRALTYQFDRKFDIMSHNQELESIKTDTKIKASTNRTKQLGYEMDRKTETFNQAMLKAKASKPAVTTIVGVRGIGYHCRHGIHPDFCESCFDM